MKDYYALLGLESVATKTQIKKNYRKLASKYHPDKNSAPDSAAKFIVITEAYDVLSNRKSRTKYDLMRWEMLERKEDNSTTFKTVTPLRESARTRRNKAQQKRSVHYHHSKGTFKKWRLLATESFIIISRYGPHILGIPLIVVIINSAISQLSDAFELGIGRGLGICFFIALLAYTLFWIIQNVIQELKKDNEAYSVFYKIDQKRAAVNILSVFILLVVLVASVLRIL